MGRGIKFLFLFAVLVFVFVNTSVLLFAADDTTPDILMYEGRLLNSLGEPLTNEHVMRFSFWKSEDFVVSDKNPDGSINAFSLAYGGWSEVHSFVPNDDGTFSLKLGSINPLPEIIYDEHKFLQVEVKVSGEADFSYQLMDPTGDDGLDNYDRATISAMPFAKNAERLDDNEIGMTTGDIALVGPNDQWDPALIPDQTYEDSFTIDGDDSVLAGSIALNFGNLLNKILSFDIDNGYFNFNDSVNIEGDLTILGTINGVNIGPTLKAHSLVPEYRDVVVDADGTNNRGKLESFYVDNDGSPGPDNINHYKWTTKQPNLNDIDLVIRYKLPETFDSWGAVPMTFDFKTETNDLLNNKLDIIVEDCLGASVLLVGASDLNSVLWDSTDISFLGGTWNPGEYFTVKVRLFSDQLGAAYAGDLVFNYVSGD